MPIGKCLECRRIYITARQPTEADACPKCAGRLQPATLEEAEATINGSTAVMHAVRQPEEETTAAIPIAAP